MGQYDDGGGREGKAMKRQKKGPPLGSGSPGGSGGW